MLYCPACLEQIKEKSKQCLKCGLEILHCPICKEKIKEKSKQCLKCRWQFFDPMESLLLVNKKEYAKKIKDYQKKWKEDQKSIASGSDGGTSVSTSTPYKSNLYRGLRRSNKLSKSMRNIVNRVINNAFGKMHSYTKNCLCPYCFSRFKISETPFRCKSHPNLCDMERDEQLEKYWGITEHKNAVVPAASGYVDEKQCPKCHTKTNIRLCPRCHQKLPMHLAERQQLTIAIVGAKFSGKSNFLPVLLQTLTQCSDKTGISWLQANDHTIERFKRDFCNYIDRNKVVPATTASATEVNTRLPLIFNFTIEDKISNTTKKISISYFDSGGEDFRTIESLGIYNRYIVEADGILFLVDPLQIPSIRQELLEREVVTAETELPEIAEVNASQVLSTIINQFDRQRRGTGKFDTPIAMVFTKFDAIQTLIDENSVLQMNMPVCNKINVDDYVATQKAMQEFLEKYDSDWNLLTNLEHNFDSVACFIVSSLGQMPNGEDLGQDITPHRIADPLMWLFYQNKIIDCNNRKSAGE